MAGAAIPVANGECQFVDGNGLPYAGGTVAMYVPGTLTLKTIWQDYQQTTPQANPVTLDANGRALIFGVGYYRQILKDINANTIWDQVTAALLPSCSPSWEFLGGTPPGSSEVMGMMITDINLSFQPNFAGSFGACLVNPTSTFTATISLNGSPIGTIVISTAGAFSFTTIGGTGFTCTAGSLITITAQSGADATLANLAWVLSATPAP